ncbi:MAG TPA: hypothetical protein VFK57_06220 [Vicinamibacterales bacterium]|nr:hypothetical protein [Vicinamibacterales bacterium]
MTWLLALYPRRWRRRYGAEVAELLAGRRFSVRLAIDLAAGAIDVWLHPAQTLAAASAAASGKDETTMLNRILRFDCAGAYGPGVSKEDAWKAGLSMVVVTLALTAAWLPLRLSVGEHPVVDSIGMMPFFVGLVVSMRYTYLKGRSPAVQAVFIGGVTLALTLVFLAAGLIAARI